MPHHGSAVDPDVIVPAPQLCELRHRHPPTSALRSRCRCGSLGQGIHAGREFMNVVKALCRPRRMSTPVLNSPRARTYDIFRSRLRKVIKGALITNCWCSLRGARHAPVRHERRAPRPGAPPQLPRTTSKGPGPLVPPKGDTPGAGAYCRACSGSPATVGAHRVLRNSGDNPVSQSTRPAQHLPVPLPPKPSEWLASVCHGQHANSLLSGRRSGRLTLPQSSRSGNPG
jgi:hypothetical protein